LRASGHEVLLLISEKKVDAEASAKYPQLRFETVPAVAKPPTLSPRMLPFLVKTWRAMGHCKAILRGFQGGCRARHGRLHLAAAGLCRPQTRPEDLHP
jgi:UDP-N-acetylglucosamine--N-acetylmuramyl-(pentapeptide) pyrophosphoryl-undecaprenol N-acetylglucosamine transferase